MTSRERARRLHDKLHGMHADDCADMCSEIIALALDEARSAALEEAAKWAIYYGTVNPRFDQLAEQIRALKGTP